LKRKLKNYFTFNKKERNGILLLSFLLSILIIFYQFTHLFKTEHKTDFPNFNKAIQELKYANDIPKLKTKESLFIFNPNTLNDDGWLALGLSKGKLQVLEIIKKVEDISNKLWT